MFKKKQTKQLIFSYVKGTELHFITLDSDEIKVVSEEYLKQQNIKNFSIGSTSYRKTHEDLLRYRDDLIRLNDELRSVEVRSNLYAKYHINYFNFFNHNHAVLQLFKFLYTEPKNSKGMIGIDPFSMFEPIAQEEFFILEQCYNGGMIGIDPQYVGTPIGCYGYDFKRYYFNMMVKANIPSKPGQKLILDTLQLPIKFFGIVRIKVTFDCSPSINPFMRNFFNVSRHHHYVSTIINQLYAVRDKFGIQFELCSLDADYDYHAYVYKSEDLIPGRDLFGSWHKQLSIVQERFPNNVLLKKLQQLLWGLLSEFKYQYVKCDKTTYLPLLDGMDISYRDDVEYTRYKIREKNQALPSGDLRYIDTTDAFKYGGIGRLKYFLTTFGRKFMMQTILEQQIENYVVRVHTDGIVLNVNHDFMEMHNNKPKKRKMECTNNMYEYYVPQPEAKTSGFIIWENKLFGFYYCCTCFKKMLYNEYKEHSCTI